MRLPRVCLMADSAQKKKQSYDAAFKLKVLNYASQHSNRAAARIYGVDEKRVREWKKLRETLEKLPAKKKRLDGAGQKAALPDIEDMFILWIEPTTYASPVVLSNEKHLNSLKTKDTESF